MTIKYELQCDKVELKEAIASFCFFDHDDEEEQEEYNKLIKDLLVIEDKLDELQA